MEQMDIAVKIENVKKEYRLGTIGGGTLQGDIQSWWARKRGKEDPNSLVGSKYHKKNETFMALDGINLTIYKGERVGIIGHNGAGKSTLLKLLSRVTAPTDGKIYINGRIASMLEVGTGFNPELTGRENIYLNGAILGMTRDEVDRKIEKIIDFSECRQFIDTPVKRYSSGMYVKLAFSVAAHLDNEIMIMDEVLAVGDVAFQNKCLNKMSQVSENEGRTILYVSHNMNTIRQLCDRCIVLNHGKVLFDGNTGEAIALYIDNREDSPRFLDFTNTERNRTLMEGIKIENIEVLNRNSWKINVGEKLEFRVHAKASKDINHAGFRSRLSTVDDTSISVILARKFISCKAGEDIEFDLLADVSQLVPGRYCLTPSIYVSNDLGGSGFYDHLPSAILFEVETTDDFNENITWDQRWWGHIKLPEYEVKNLSCHEEKLN